MATLTQHIKDGFDNRYTKLEVDTKIINVSNTGKSSMLSGTASVSNTTVMAGMSTTLYTGNGSTQSIDAGVDLATQWGSDANETYGGLVWLKGRELTTNHILYDTIRGVNNCIRTNTTDAQLVGVNGNVTAFNSNGYDVSSGIETGYNAPTSYQEASWIFQTTHRISGTTNHGKNYTCHYNPITGFTIVKYEGSGIAGHEIPHHLGRKLGFATVKNLTTTGNFGCYVDGMQNEVIYMNLANAKTTNATFWNNTQSTDELITVSTNSDVNTNTNQYIMYGWANSYFDDAGVLNGNYEVGVYQGAVIGTKVLTRGKPAWIMVKRLDNTESWAIVDNARNDYALFANLSQTDIPADYFDFVSDGFILKANSTAMGAIGGQYLYMVVYDNDSGSGKSKFNMASETSNIQFNNLVVSFTNGVDANGVKNTIKNLGNFTVNPSNGWSL